MKTTIKDLLTNSDFRRFILNPNQLNGSYWIEWKNQSSENQEAFDEAKSLIEGFYEPLSAEEFQNEAISFKRKIDITHVEKNDIISLYENRRPSRNPWFLWIAASIVIILCSVFAISLYLENVDSSDIAHDPTKTLIKKEAGKGQKLTIMLQDGSKVKLNSESFITYPEEFSTDVREVTISGEVFFDIVHKDDWPFIVNSKDVCTKVLGTSFNISAYPEDCCVNIGLVEGEVEVTALNKPIVQLKPSEMAHVKTDLNEIIVTDFDVEKVTAWRDNLLGFEGASFDEVEATIERWYNVDFVYETKPVFEGGYDLPLTNANLEAIMSGISENKFDFRVKGNKVFIN